MKPKIGQKVTYVDESCTEYTAKITEIFTHENGKPTLSIEYRHEDRKTRTVKGVPFIDGIHDVKSAQKVMCFSKRTPKKAPKESKSTSDNTARATTTTATSTETSEEQPVIA